MKRVLGHALAALSCLALGTAVVAQPAAQEVKAPKIESVALAAPVKAAFKYAKGDAEKYVIRTKGQGHINVEFGGTPMEIGMAMVMSMDLPVKCVDTEKGSKLEVTCEHLTMDMDTDVPTGAVKVTVRDKNIRATMGETVIVDTANGQGGEFAAGMAAQAKLIGQKFTMLISPTGKVIGKPEGDPTMAKSLLQGTSGGLFGVVLPDSGELKTGDTWTTDLSIATLDAIQLKTPAVMKAKYTVAGGATVDGVSCVDIQFEIAAKIKDLQAEASQAGQNVNMDKANMAVAMKGHAYFDPATGRVVYNTATGTVEVTGDFDAAGVGSGKLAVNMNISTSSTRSIPK